MTEILYVPIRVFRNNGQIEADTPIRLFGTQIGGPIQDLIASRQQYVVYNDGQSFLQNTVTHVQTSPTSVILNLKPKS